MISELISEIFDRIGHTWKYKDGGFFKPTEDDVDEMLDKAAAHLYDGDEGDQFESGGLIIQRTPTGHDVFVYVGTYF